MQSYRDDSVRWWSGSGVVPVFVPVSGPLARSVPRKLLGGRLRDDDDADNVETAWTREDGRAEATASQYDASRALIGNATSDGWPVGDRLDMDWTSGWSN